MDTGTTDDPIEPEPKSKPKRPRKRKTAAELVEQGIGRYGAGRKAQARESLQKALELEPENVDAWYWLALATNDRVEQRAHFQRVLDIDPSHAEAKRWVEQIDILAASQARLTQARVAAPPPRSQRPVFRNYDPRVPIPPAPGLPRSQQVFVGLLAALAIIVLLAVGFTSGSGGAAGPAPEYYTNPVLHPTFTPVSAPAPVHYGGSGGSTCADGTHSSSTGRGTCSHHGGVR